MKSLLSENMLRFGTKNLTATSKQELIVKSIMETIDQHGLRKTIYNRLVEQTDPNAEVTALKTQGVALKVVGMILAATTGTMGIGTDEQKIADAIKMIPRNGGQPVYDAVLNLVKQGTVVKQKMGKNFKTVMDLIATEFHRTSDTGEGQSDTKWMNSFKSILKQYNEDENEVLATGGWYTTDSDVG